MAVTQFVTLDQSTLNNSIYTAFKSSAALTRITANCFKFEFEPIVLYHALQLLSLDPSRYGMDLQDYLAPVIQYYTQHSPSQFTDLDFGTTDYKRRAAENLGVSIASLLMVEVLGVHWDTIAQIQSVRKQRGRKPDFVAYSSSKGYVYEAKGTSRPHNISKQIKDATEQLRSLPLRGKGKIGFVSFFPGEIGHLYPSTHVFDPPFNLLIPDHDDALQRHYIQRLSFLELNESAALFSDFMDAKLLAQSTDNSNLHYRAEDRAKLLRVQFNGVFRKEIESLKSIKVGHWEHVSRSKEVSVRDRRVHYTASCIKEYLDPFSPPASDAKASTGYEAGRKRAESAFMDGTRIVIEW